MLPLIYVRASAGSRGTRQAADHLHLVQNKEVEEFSNCFNTQRLDGLWILAWTAFTKNRQNVLGEKKNQRRILCQQWLSCSPGEKTEIWWCQKIFNWKWIVEFFIFNYTIIPTNRITAEVCELSRTYLLVGSKIDSRFHQAKFAICLGDHSRITSS